MTTARPLARYGALWKARVASGLATAGELHHVRGHDHCVSPITDIESNRAACGVTDSYKRTLVPLAYLAPDIQAAILEGCAPAGLTLEHLQSLTLPISWVEQRRALGFPAG